MRSVQWCARRLLAALAVLAALAHPAVLAQAQSPSLFTAEPQARKLALPGPPDQRNLGGLRRIARVDRGRLDALQKELADGRQARLRLNLFDDVEFEATLERRAETGSGFALSGPLEGTPFGRVVLVVNDQLTMGRVYTPRGNYSMRGAGDLLTVERMAPQPRSCVTLTTPDLPAGLAGGFRKSPALSENRSIGALRSSRGDGAGTVFANGVSTGTPNESNAKGSNASGDGRVVDVLVVYPSFVRDLEGGYAAMLSLIDLDIATANEAYAASGVNLRVELAAAVEVDYDRFLESRLDRSGISSSYWIDAVEHLTEPDDGQIDEVHALRDEHAADLVLLHMGGGRHDTFGDYVVGGIAWTMPEVSQDSLERWGFAVAMSGDGTFVAHELGHSMGLMHDRHRDTGNEPFPYSHGYRYEHSPPNPDQPGETYPPRWHGTVMSQLSGRDGYDFFLAFSNPELVHPSDPNLRLGVAGDEPSSDSDGPADATRHLNELRETLVNVRTRGDAGPCRYELAGDEGELTASGGTYSVRVDTQTDCEWTANLGDWVSPVSETRGTGSGEISYTVAANDGFRRTVEVEVSGQVHARAQVGARPITPVCDRSWRIKDFLMDYHPDYRYETELRGGFVHVTYETQCEDLVFDAEYLASFANLRRPNFGYDGFIVAEIKHGDFDGLSGLFQLWLRSMERVPSDLFSGLTNLRILKLGEDIAWVETPPLRGIQPGAFRGLSGLLKLTINEHRLGAFEGRMLEGMPRLVDLGVYGNFAHRDIATNIVWIKDDSDRPVTGIAPGTFSELPNLHRLKWVGHTMEKLEPGTFSGLRKLRALYLDRDAIANVELGAFDGMPKLRILRMSDYAFETLPPGVFENLPELSELMIVGGELSRLPPGVFDGLSKLWLLQLDFNSLKTLDRNVFSGLKELELLGLHQNRLRSLPGGLFRDLESLRGLWLYNNELGDLEPGIFDGLVRLDYLLLSRSHITSILPGTLNHLTSLKNLRLFGNKLRRIAPGTFRGLSLERFTLAGNPGAPFTFAQTPSIIGHSNGNEGYPEALTIDGIPEAPFDIDAELSTIGGTLSATNVRIPAGTQSSTQVEVTPDGDARVTVRVDRTQRRDAQQDYHGYRVAPGPPLVLYGFPDVDLTVGRGTRSFDLASVFSYFLGDAVNYEVSSSQAAVASVDVEDGTLRLNPKGAGASEVTVTATGPGGETVTRRFSVRIGATSLPLMLASSHQGREGFVRVVNRSDTAGTVHITVVDDGGTRHGPVRLRLRPFGAEQFNSTDLEEGNDAKRLLEGVGAGLAEGDWRLEFESDLDIEALSYVRTEDGFLTPIHDTAPFEGGAHRIVTFNPASNMRQASRLRVINTGREEAEVTVRGMDDTGSSPGNPVRFSVSAGAVREFDSVQLETGGADFDGALGNGEGKWRLTVESESPISAMSLLENTLTGHLTNLSSVPPRPDHDGIHHVALFLAAGNAHGRQGFVRVINRSNSAGTVNIAAFDDTGTEYGPLELTVDAGAAAHFNSEDLELGAAGKGLSGSTGTGEGDWRLELSSDLDLEVLAYARAEDGFLTELHNTVAVREGRREVVTFNPGSNTDQLSMLRLVNPTSERVSVAIVGTDDIGSVPGFPVWVDVSARSAVTVSAAELEAGVADEILEGLWHRWPLKDGVGKWRLNVEAPDGVRVISLLESPAGHLTNLSSDGR